MEFFWKKKTIISFIMALMVMFIHSTALTQYLSAYSDGSAMTAVVDALNNFLGNGLNSLAVPLYFVISGATFFRDYKKGMYLKKLKSRLFSLIIPYLIWNTLAMCFDIICSYSPLSQYFTGREVFELSLSNILEGILFYDNNCAFWFLFSIIIFVILTPVFDIATSRPWIGWIFVAFTFTLPIYAQPLFVACRMESDSVVFYAIGVMLGKYYFNFFSEKGGRRKIWISAAAFAVSLAARLVFIYTEGSIFVLFKQADLIVLCLSFWFMLDGIIEVMKAREVFMFSFFIYALHQNIMSSLIKIFQIILPKSINMAIPNMIVSYVITIAAVLIIAWFMKKKLPKVYNVLSGSR